MRQARRHRVPNDKRSRVNAVVEEGPVEVAIVPIPAHAVDTADLLTGRISRPAWNMMVRDAPRARRTDWGFRPVRVRSMLPSVPMGCW